MPHEQLAQSLMRLLRMLSYVMPIDAKAVSANLTDRVPSRL